MTCVNHCKTMGKSIIVRQWEKNNFRTADKMYYPELKNPRVTTR